MDYLRNLGSAAASSLLQKSGITLPFSLGDKVSYYEGKTIWTLYEATKRDDSSPVSVFYFDASLPNHRNLLPLARNALRKLRTIRHPDVLKFIDVVDAENTIYIVTERVQPLGQVLQGWASKSERAKEDWLIWGLHRISVALAFVNDSCQSTHGNIRVDSVFTSSSGEWKLGGFDVLSNAKDDAAVLYTLGGLVPESNMYSAPEVKKSGWSVLKEQDPQTTDSYALGLLIHSVFNPTHPLPPTTQPPHPPPAPSSRGAIPTYVFPCFKRLLNPTPKSRLSPKSFLAIGMRELAGDGAGFFCDNRLVSVCVGLDSFSLGSESEKTALLRTLKESAENFPPEFAAHKVLPSLLSALEFGGASAATILPLVLQLGKLVPPGQYSATILGPLVKLFASPDRATRMALLDHLEEYADKLDKALVTDKVWPHLQTGFGDTVAVIREATVRSIILIAPKFSDRIMNNDLLRHLAKSQLDPEPSIRTNTCILLGRLAPSLGPNTKRKVLVPAFGRAIKDTFVHARVAGLMALMATVDCYDMDDLAGKVIPTMAFTLMDKEKLVRDQAFKAMEVFVSRLEAHAATMPETVLSPEGQTETGMTTPNGAPLQQATLVNSAAGAAGALAGWAISSLGKKLATSELSSTISSDPGTVPPASSEPSIPGSFSGSPPPAVILPSKSASAPAPKGPSKGMQLGGSHKSPTITFGAADIAAEEAAEEVAGAWGGDLMDVNADADDWGSFEAAPVASPAGLASPLPATPGFNLGFGATSPGVPGDDGWGESFEPVSPPPQPQPNLSTARARARAASPTQNARRPTPRTKMSNSSGLTAATSETDATSRPQSPSGNASNASLASMSKEEKAAEMARRREERRLRIAQLKEQKKNAAAGASPS